jgi:hypothetical protein
MDNMEGETMTSGVITTQLYGASGYTYHYPIYTVIKRHVPSTQGPTKITRRKINATTSLNFKKSLDRADFNGTMVDDPSEAMDKFMGTVMQAFDESFPEETIKVRKYKQGNSFMTGGLMKSCQTRDKMLKNINKKEVSKNSTLFTRFKTYRNMLTTLIRKQKKNHFNEQFEKHKGDIRKTLGLVKDIINKSNDKHSITSTRFCEDGKCIEDDSQAASGFNSFFASVGPQTNSKVKASKHSPKIVPSKTQTLK